MFQFFEQLTISLWNWLQGRRRRAQKVALGITLGFLVADEQITGRRVGPSQVRRTMHMALLGKTGSGKSSLLKYLCLQDIEAGRGFIVIVLMLTPGVLVSAWSGISLWQRIALAAIGFGVWQWRRPRRQTRKRNED